MQSAIIAVWGGRELEREAACVQGIPGALDGRGRGDCTAIEVGGILEEHELSTNIFQAHDTTASLCRCFRTRPGEIESWRVAGTVGWGGHVRRKKYLEVLFSIFFTDCEERKCEEYGSDDGSW